MTNYEYEEVDAHGAFRAFKAGEHVEYLYSRVWHTLTSNNSLWLLVDDDVKFRIRREKKRETVEEMINGSTWTVGDKILLCKIAAALKAEILDRIEPGCLKPQGGE